MSQPTGHLDDSGRLRMIEVGSKIVTKRRAVASGSIRMRPDVLDAIDAGAIVKGDVLAVAQVAGVQAAKATPSLIPGCHPVNVSGIRIRFERRGDSLHIESEITGTDRTGLEMEALTAVSVAALTVYDMCKGTDPTMVIGDIKVEAKSGGKSDAAVALDSIRAAVITVSDRSATGQRPDKSGPAAVDWLESHGATVVSATVVADESDEIVAALKDVASSCDLVITTGGTGVSARDVTPEATLEASDREVPGLAEAIRATSRAITPNAMLSRGVAVLIGEALVINLPGSPKAVGESLDAVMASLPHAVKLLRGEQPHA